MTDVNTSAPAGDELPEGYERQRMDVDVACVGFGPAMGGFLHTLSQGLTNEDGTPVAESKAMPGMPPQVICYERADDLGFGVSGVVTKGRGIRASFPDLDLTQIPLATEVKHEEVLYLLDPVGASRRPVLMRLADKALKIFGMARNHAFKLPYVPGFLRKEPGILLSMGQFNQWAGGQIMAQGQAQIWPGTPVAGPILSGKAVAGVRLQDQGVDKRGVPEAGFMPGMDIHSQLVVVGDGPVGAVGRKLDEQLGLPAGNHAREWAVGMKMVVDLPEGCQLKAGTVLHTLGYPEPEIFGFLYVYPGNVASLGIFVPSWFDNPVRTAYRYLQHWMQHPVLWKHLKGGRMRSWGAKSLQESGKRGEPFLAGDGFARIGEGSGTTNVLTGSGVDEAWTSGVLLGVSVLELLKADQPFTRENIEKTYVRRRQESWLEREAKIAEKARDGFQNGVVQGLIGMALTGLTEGKLFWPGASKKPHERIPSIESYFQGRISAEEIAAIRKDCTAKGLPLHGALMDRAGWPKVEHDGQLLVSHQDALLMGGKVQAPSGYRDHVTFKSHNVCAGCGEKVCIEACSGQAISANPEGGAPLFDREKCVHCGACLWNCSKPSPGGGESSNVDFQAGAGGLHSAEN
ncbi:MAG: 4Fe-4S ferredoxin [Humidesulfovibrio sp.]|nr:4Fe-4S ferredoxin [Humidesulfovibrio sp.]